MRKVEDVAVGKFRMCVGILLISATALFAQEMTENEMQFNLNGYFDNFHVQIFYPSFSITKQINPSTQVNGHYLVDAISAASMRSRFDVDGVTSATSPNGIKQAAEAVDGVTSASTRSEGGGGSDEVRNEFSGGITRQIGAGSMSANGIFSTEHDYTSKTVTSQISWPFAKKNTIVQLGVVRSWDTSFPDTRTWKKHKDVVTLSGGFTQVLSTRAIAQVDASYATHKGFLSDPYQVIRIIEGDTFKTLESKSPDSRIRKAVGIRLNYKIARMSALQLGYRYYWDDWEIKSHTIHAMLQKHLMEKNVTIGLGWRYYTQSKAYFFQENYTGDEVYLTVDSKLDECFSNTFESRIELNSILFKNIPFLEPLASERSVFLANLNFYQRQTATPNWFSRYKNLYAYMISAGWRYRF